MFAETKPHIPSVSELTTAEATLFYSKTVERYARFFDRPEQRLLIADHAHVGQTVPAVGEHHCQVPHDPARVMPAAPLTQARQAHRQRSCQTTLIGDLSQQRAARMRHQPLPVRPDFYRDTAAIALHPQGDPP